MRKTDVPSRWCHRLATGLFLGLLAACGDGSGTPSPGAASSAPPPVVGSGPYVSPPLPASPSGALVVRASDQTPFATDCGGPDNGGTLYLNAEVEPSLAANPGNADNLVAVWQQDRWSNGGARGILAGASFDGGRSWSRTPLPFSSCAGGAYARASNPWVSMAPDGTVHALALAFSGNLLASDSQSGMLASRSLDGGRTWSAPVALVADTGAFFSDKGAITAEPGDAQRVYAVWDRLTGDDRGPTLFARSLDGGASWQAARAIYDPGVHNQTISNVVVVGQDGALVDLFTELDTDSRGSLSTLLRAMRSTDQGTTWGAPVTVSPEIVPGVVDPQTGASLRTSEIIPSQAVAPDGTLYVAWQDARFSASGRVDGIALAKSLDGGSSWSTPIQVNAAHGAQAFSPTVAVAADGTLAISYYDFRDDTADAGTLLTDYWLARSRDGGATFTERQLAGPFDLDLAPDTRGSANGRFLGDYQGLASVGGTLLPTYTQTNAGSQVDRTDIYALVAVPPAASSSPPAKVGSIAGTLAMPPDAAERTLIDANLRRLRRARLGGP